MKSNFYSSFVGPAKGTWLGLLLAGLLAGQATAAPGTVSELLEKGIYSEETRGDIENAIKLYEQVIADSKGGQALAAQAQYRLGVCLHKKKNYAESAAAFEKLIKNYPEETELVGQARKYLAGTVALMPAPWSDHEQLIMDIRFPTGFKLGSAIYTVNAGERDGKKIWNIGSRLFAGVHSFSRVEVDAETFRPLHSRWKHNLIGDVDAEYSANSVLLKTLGKEGNKKVELSDIVYDNEQAIQLMRRLPFEDKYKNTFRFLSSLAGTIVPVGVEVSGPEKVTVPAGTFDCYKAQLSINQTFWYSADPRHYLVKFEGGGALAELADIRQRKLTDPDSFQDPSMGFSITAPAGWFICRQSGKDDKVKTSLSILDPEAVASCELIVQTVDSLKPEAKKSLRDWAEADTAEGSKFLKDLKTRPHSWKETTLAGQPALSVMRDFNEAGQDKVNYSILMVGPKTAARFSMSAEAKDFDAAREKLDAIAANYKLTK